MGDSKMDISLLKVKNRWEELVDTAIERMLEEGAFSCSCGKCRADVGAIALNSLPPDYVPVGVGAARRLPPVRMSCSIGSARQKLRCVERWI